MPVDFRPVAIRKVMGDRSFKRIVQKLGIDIVHPKYFLRERNLSREEAKRILAEYYRSKGWDTVTKFYKA